MKQQFLYINGWEPKENFNSYYDFLTSIEFNPYKEKFQSWNKTFWEKLGDDWEYLRAPFQERSYADYEAWKIMFEKLFPYLRDDIIVWAGSLWATFLLKYMWENDFPVKIQKLFFIAPAISDTPNEKLGSFEFNIDLVYGRVQRATKQIYIYHSRDDACVPFEQWLELHSYFPDSIFREFDHRGHFFMQAELPELLEDIKN